MYKLIFKDIFYPDLLNTIDDLKLSKIPPWEFLNDDYETWKSFFDKAHIYDFVPIARMVNDDVVATFNTKSGSGEIFLFNLPLFANSTPFKQFGHIELWLKSVMDDSYEYITEY